MPEKYTQIKNRECWWCGRPEHVTAIHRHHVAQRSTNPELIHEESNLMDLCERCHRRATDNQDFFDELANLWKKRHQEN